MIAYPAYPAYREFAMAEQGAVATINPPCMGTPALRLKPPLLPLFHDTTLLNPLRILYLFERSSTPLHSTTSQDQVPGAYRFIPALARPEPMSR